MRWGCGGKLNRVNSTGRGEREKRKEKENETERNVYIDEGIKEGNTKIV